MWAAIKHHRESYDLNGFQNQVFSMSMVWLENNLDKITSVPMNIEFSVH